MKAKRYMRGESKRTERFLDRRGIAYADRYRLVPARTDQWPPYPSRIKDDKAGAQGVFHEEFRGTPCWLCGETTYDFGWPAKRGELHHLAAGSRGRTMEREVFTWLCRQCHVDITPGHLPILLWAKWKFDRDWFDIEWLTLRHGHHLPELEVPEWCKDNT